MKEETGKELTKKEWLAQFAALAMQHSEPAGEVFGINLRVSRILPPGIGLIGYADHPADSIWVIAK